MMEISARQLLNAIKRNTLKANAHQIREDDQIRIELQADGQPFATLSCTQSLRARATFGKTVHLLPGAGADEVSIPCNSEVDAIRIAMEIDTCLKLAYDEAMGTADQRPDDPSLGTLLTILKKNAPLDPVDDRN